MSLPTPHSLDEQKKKYWKKLNAMETFDDIISRSPQEARPFLLSTTSKADDRSVELKNGFIMTYNGVLIDRRDLTYCEPIRLLDGNIKYGDGWERKNNGTFVAPSGLMIDRNLTLYHKNGQTVYPDGTTVMPSGKVHEVQGEGPHATVGIIYRPGLSVYNGIHFWPLVEQGSDPKYFQDIVPADPSKGVILPPMQPGSRGRGNTFIRNSEQMRLLPSGPIGAAGSGWKRNGETGGLLPPGSSSIDTPSTLNKYVPPHMRNGNGDIDTSPTTPTQALVLANHHQDLTLPSPAFQTRPPVIHRPPPTPANQRRSLTVDEIKKATPSSLHGVLDECDLTECGTDLWGIPMCIGSEDRGAIFPYVKAYLDMLNSGLGR